MGLPNIRLIRVCLVLFLALFLVIPSHVFALKMFSGDKVVVGSPIDDDVFVSGGIIEINAPVSGLIAGGGALEINAPVSGDVLVAGGEVSINSDVGGKVVAAGGNIKISGNIGTNLLVAGGNVEIAPGVLIGRDATISAGRVVNEGEVKGILTVIGGDLENRGLAGEVRIEHPKIASQLLSEIINFLLIVSFFASGIILLIVFPELFKSTEEVIRESPLKSTVTGLILGVASPFLIILFLLSIIGIPVAFFLAFAFILSLMLSILITSFALGRLIFWVFGWKKKFMAAYSIGFILLVIAFKYFWFGCWLIVFSMLLGGGALFYAARDGFGRRRFGTRVKEWFKGSVKSIRKRFF